MSTLSDYLVAGLFGGVGASLYLTGGLFGDGVEGTALGGGITTPDPEAGSVEDILSDVVYDDIAAVQAQEVAVRWDLPSSRQTVVLGSEVFDLQLTYRRRQASWYLSVWDLDGELVFGGRRLTPGWAMNLGRVNGPDGLLLVTGPEDYRRDDLGTRLRVTFYPRGDVEQPLPNFADTLVDFS